MTISFEWGLQGRGSLECAASLGGNENVVKVVHWRLTGTDGTHSGETVGAQAIPFDGGDGFTPYEELTLETVIAWVKAAMGAEQVATKEAAVADQIAVQANPPVVTPPLPWEQPAP